MKDETYTQNLGQVILMDIVGDHHVPTIST